MAKRRTREELESTIKGLEAYQEAFFCLQNGRKPIKIKNEQRTVWLLGAGRSSGGVVFMEPEGYTVRYATEWASEASRSVDPYIADLGRKVHACINAAVKAVYEAEVRESPTEAANE
jgi:hypothetical protein